MREEIEEMMGREMVKEGMMNKWDVVMVVEERKLKEGLERMKRIVGVREVECKKIFRIKGVEKKEGGRLLGEVFMGGGRRRGVYGVEEGGEW